LEKVKKKIAFNVNTKGTVLKVGSREVLGLSCWELLIKTNHPDIEDAEAYFYYPVDTEEFSKFHNSFYYKALYEHNIESRKKNGKITMMLNYF